MADTAASLAVEVANLETALSNAIALGASASLPTGQTYTAHNLDQLDRLLRQKKTRLARLQAIEAGRPPFQAQVV